MITSKNSVITKWLSPSNVAIPPLNVASHLATSKVLAKGTAPLKDQFPATEFVRAPVADTSYKKQTWIVTMKIRLNNMIIMALAAGTSLFFAAIFGFFYAWSVSTLWGLDTIDPNISIAAMNAMNISVHNMAFMPAFFITPSIGVFTGAILTAFQHRTSGLLLIAASVIYFLGAFLPTAMINVPMNEALKLVETPMNIDQARAIWEPYSADWKFWNGARMFVAAGSFLLTAIALITLRAPLGDYSEISTASASSGNAPSPT